MKYYISTLFIILALSGCSFKQVKPTSYYTIENNTALQSYPNSNKSIHISKPLINTPYESKNIFFTQKAYVFDAYVVNKWVDFPHLLIQNMLYETFRNSALFSDVALENSTINSTFALQTHLMKLFHKYEQNDSFAIIDIKFEVLEHNKVINTFWFSKKILCEENTPYGFVKGVNQGFEEITLELLNSLKQTI